MAGVNLDSFLRGLMSRRAIVFSKNYKVCCFSLSVTLYLCGMRERLPFIDARHLGLLSLLNPSQSDLKLIGKNMSHPKIVGVGSGVWSCTYSNGKSCGGLIMASKDCANAGLCL